MMPLKVVFLAVLIVVSSAFTFEKMGDMAKRGFESFKNKFGDRYWRKTSPDLEEVVYAGEDGSPEETQKAAL